MPSPYFPIQKILPQVSTSLQSHTNLLLHAPPGAGKTTQIPPALLSEPWMKKKRIIMLEPRRLAAKNAARFMARQQNEEVGKTVGYRIRHETRVGTETRIEVVTEGILTKILQNDPELSEYGCVIFDEFHERNLTADLGLALTLESQDALRKDLRILVMSATLDCTPITTLMGEAPVISSQGNAFPVTTHYVPAPLRNGYPVQIEEHTASVIQHAIVNQPGGILVFLPGAREIHTVLHKLTNLPPGTTIYPLYGNLPQSAQDAAIAPPLPKERKVVLATSIAETSLTIEGIETVIDSGLTRSPQFSPRTGMTQLVTGTVSRATATQRKGRAGRTCPGTCYRLWSKAEHANLSAFSSPEITKADLTPLVLELALWGTTDPTSLAWLDPPQPANFAEAQKVLQSMCAIDAKGKITPHGKELSGIPLHPRLSHMLLTAKEKGMGETACLLAAFLEERSSKRTRESNIYSCLHDIANAPTKQMQKNLHDLARCARISLPPKWDNVALDSVGSCIALAYPERLARKKGRGQFLLANGKLAWLPQEDPLADEPFLAVADMDGKAPKTRIFGAAPISCESIENMFHTNIFIQNVVEWNEQTEMVTACTRRYFRHLVLSELPLKTGDYNEEIIAAVLNGIRQLGMACLPWDAETKTLRARIAFLKKNDTKNWPDVSEATLLETLEQWLAPFLMGISKREQFKKIPLAKALTSLLDWPLQQRLQTHAPTHVQVPSGSQCRIDYTGNADPVLPVKLQEMFGSSQTPTIIDGKYPLLVHLLSPAGRPLQVTRDLNSFWENGYVHVRAEMRGRYPKHPWPENPRLAAPTKKTKKQL